MSCPATQHLRVDSYRRLGCVLAEPVQDRQGNPGGNSRRPPAVKATRVARIGAVVAVFNPLAPLRLAGVDNAAPSLLSGARAIPPDPLGVAETNGHEGGNDDLQIGDN